MVVIIAESTVITDRLPGPRVRHWRWQLWYFAESEYTRIRFRAEYLIPAYISYVIHDPLSAHALPSSGKILIIFSGRRMPRVVGESRQRISFLIDSFDVRQKDCRAASFAQNSNKTENWLKKTKRKLKKKEKTINAKASRNESQTDNTIRRTSSQCNWMFSRNFVNSGRVTAGVGLGLSSL